MLIGPDDLAILKGVTGLAKAFNRQVIAEVCKPLGRVMNSLNSV